MRAFCNFRLVSFVFLSGAALMAAGCNKGPQLSSVKGRVTLDGKPLPNATVTFTPEAGGRASLGRTDENGNYQLLYSATAGGALVGPMRVRISVIEEWTDAQERTFMKPDPVPAKYNEKSDLVVDVEQKANVFDFDLTTD